MIASQNNPKAPDEVARFAIRYGAGAAAVAHWLEGPGANWTLCGQHVTSNYNKRDDWPGARFCAKCLKRLGGPFGYPSDFIAEAGDYDPWK